ncbi:MAG: DNA gyrase subunit A [Chloroflexi bacterium]|nr:DNA gyrase subunit A [Chloroflexota bacterium]MBK6708905.1 DNA gyrase subunit A [Chloroflexota bacterium]MBK7175930.1 DNA gyrase subunit A [Chloroflexota bacterium]MBK8934485.1 DNA gyrase subunit A [Chloroflexota bacterium]MBP6803889.1 DNA gyrase subunit A [Chloroflexota bacterium]
MEIGLVKQIDIEHEVKESYLSYAMSVIVSRALPDARDGLKPVQRRILYAMYDMGLRPDTPYRKSARVVGEVLGKYHPHGDQSVYDAMVRMAQDFSMRAELVDGQGNFGSIDGDPAAAMRYTEARMSNMGFDMLEDINKNTVDFSANFDDSLQEPNVLPATIPNLLVNGSSGIAVGMATSVPPHNLGEVVDALCYMLDKWDALADISVGDLMQFIKGPDFPTGGQIFRFRGDENETDVLLNAYATGRGRVTVRAKAHVERMERNKSRIVITELPYQVNKTNLLGRIADLHRDGKIDGLTDLRDESDRNGMRIILETTRNVEPEDVLAELFRLTPMQSTFSISLLALVNGAPRILTLKQALRVYLEHRLEVIKRRSEYDLEKTRQRAHILEGLLIALDNLDEVIETIRRSRTVETARANLQSRFKLSEMQAQAILDMQLRRLAGLERRKIQDEYKEKLQLIKFLERLIASPQMMRDTIKEELTAVRGKYVNSRRTQIIESGESKVITATDLLPDQQVWVMIGEKGTVARTTTPDMASVPTKPTEQPKALLEANTQDILYLFTADGQAVSLPVYQLAQARELGQGTHWADMTGLTRRHHLAAALVLPFEAEGYLFLTTLSGVVKRVRLEDLPGITTDPFGVINVADDDALGWAKVTSGEDEVLLVTASGQAIRFKEEEVRPMGLPAGGVMGIKLSSDVDGVVAMAVVDPAAYLWSVTDNGLAKATPMDQYPTQGRYGQGVINMRLPKEAAEVVAAVVGPLEANLIITTAVGTTKTMRLGQADVGARVIKPKALWQVGDRNRVTGAIQLVARLENPGDQETAVPKQLSLID